MAEETNPKDLNGDGKVTDKERDKYKKDKNKESRDRLEEDLFNSEYGWAADLVYSNAELTKLWKTAIKEGWSATKFVAKFRDSNFYQKHTESWLRLKALEETKPVAYQDAINNAAARLRDDAATLGITLTDEQARRSAVVYLRRGFNNSENASAYREWLSGKIRRGSATAPDGETINTGFSGQAGDVETALMNTLSRNGFSSSSATWKSWIADQVRSISAGNTTLNDAIDYVRRTAGSKYPTYAEKMISEGKDLQDYAQGYITTMSEILEIPEDRLDVLDPKIREAMMGSVDPEGNDTGPMSLWDFEKSLRKDSRWKYTKNANEQMSGAANYLLKSFGFMG